MRNFFICTFCACVSLFSMSCESDPKANAPYYSVDSLVNAQIAQLSQSKAMLTKKAEIDGVEETNSITPQDSAHWAHELDIFLELGVINSPVNAGNYTVENGIKDSNSNLSIRSFKGKKTKETSPVEYMKIFYLESPSNIRRIEALYREENALLKGSRFLILEFQEIHNKIMLTSYSIEGSQQMFLGDPVKFSVKGTISIP
jgi:hypothetical protein